MTQLCSSVILIFGTIIIFSHFAECVIVDGSKKQGLSAIKRQKSDEELSIDPYNVRTCGLSNPNSEDHEFVNMAREGQFPWIASFQIKILHDGKLADQKKEAARKINGQRRKLEDLHFCSGSFISDRWILSAAHCFVGETIKNYFTNDKLKVVAGSHRVSSRHRLNMNLTIGRIYYHAKFDKSSPVGFDIALVELLEPVVLVSKRDKDEFGEQSKPYVNAICLPLEGKKYSFNETARIAGWGLSNAKDVSTMPSKLLTTDILFSDQEQCVKDYQKALKSDRPKEQKEKEDDFICASYKNTRDSCQSDSGGPLMQYVNKKAVVVGIVSYGIGCATKGVPGLYTRTAAYINWIKEITTKGRNAKVNYKVFEKSTGDKLEKKVNITQGTTTTNRPPTLVKETFTTEAPRGSSPTETTAKSGSSESPAPTKDVFKKSNNSTESEDETDTEEDCA